MTTLFAIVSTFQNQENYNLDDPINVPYWKMKGSTEVVSNLYTLPQIMGMSVDEKQAVVDADTPESNEYYAYSLLGWEIVTLDDDLIERVRKHLSVESQDLGYLRYTFAGSDYAFDWACQQDPSMFGDHWDSLNDRERILANVRQAA